MLRTVRVLRPLRTMSRINGMTEIINTMILAIVPLKDVIMVVFAVFLVFSVLAVQFWTDLPRVACESSFTTCDLAAILDPAESGCVCDAVGITWAPSHRSGDHWVWAKSVPPEAPALAGYVSVATGLPVLAALNSSGGASSSWIDAGLVEYRWNDADLAACVGQPKLEQHFFCDSMGMIKFDQIIWTMIVVFQCLTLEGWTDIMYAVDGAHETSFGWAYFVALVLFAGFFVVQLALAVITNAYEVVSKNVTTAKLGAAQPPGRTAAAGDRPSWLRPVCAWWEWMARPEPPPGSRMAQVKRTSDETPAGHSPIAAHCLPAHNF